MQAFSAAIIISPQWHPGNIIHALAGALIESNQLVTKEQTQANRLLAIRKIPVQIQITKQM